MCDRMPRLSLRTRVVLLLHVSEGRKPTNTGRLACQMLTHSEVCLWSGRHEAWDPAPELPAPGGGYLLFPPDDRPPVLAENLRWNEAPRTLFVPDGTWSQVQRIVRTSPYLLSLPRLSLPEGAAARHSLRAETRPGGMSTLDAISWALAGLEGEDAVAPLDEAYRVFYERTMAIRGVPVPGGPTLKDFRSAPPGD